MKKRQTDNNRTGFSRWLLENSERVPEADQLLGDILDNVQPEPEDELTAARAYGDFRKRIGKDQGNGRWRKIGLWAQRVAAVLAIPLAAGLVFSLLSDREPEWEEIYTMTGESVTVVLPDSSTMKLAPQSRLVYPKRFGKEERRVFLTGEAYADITSDRKCPFRISSGDVEVKVLGTQFNISAYIENTECEIALVEGSVELQVAGRDEALTLAPGERAVYDRKTGEVALKSFVPEYYRSVEQNDGCQFINMRFIDIASYLERRFGVKIFIADESIGEERFYASFINDEGVDEILDILNMEGRFDISRNGNTILIE